MCVYEALNEWLDFETQIICKKFQTIFIFNLKKMVCITFTPQIMLESQDWSSLETLEGFIDYTRPTEWQIMFDLKKLVISDIFSQFFMY